MTLVTAHAALESLTLERSLAKEKRRLDALWADLVYEGLWFSPVKKAIDAFAEEAQRSVTGDVRVDLEPGTCRVSGRRSPHSLYDMGLATYDEGDSFEHSDASGFVRLWGLSTKKWAKTNL